MLKKVISEYTREAGVRTLEKTIAKICRKIAYKVVEEGGDAQSNDKNLHEFLGAPILLTKSAKRNRTSWCVKWISLDFCRWCSIYAKRQL